MFGPIAAVEAQKPNSQQREARPEQFGALLFLTAQPDRCKLRAFGLAPQTGNLCINHRMIESDGITNTCHLRTTTSQCLSGQHKVSMVGSSSSRREEEEEEVQDRPAGCYYPDSAQQAGNTEKCAQKSRTGKFLPRREVPYTRGPEPGRVQQAPRVLLHDVSADHPPKLAGTPGVPGALPRKRPCPGAEHGSPPSLSVFQKLSSRFRPRQRHWSALQRSC